MKTNQEKWDEIVQKISELGEELQELVDSIPSETKEGDLYHFPSDVDGSLLGLRLTVDELMDQEIPENDD